MQADLPSLALGGAHHTARPTWKLKETVEFYRDIMGLPLVHAITARGWGPAEHPDFVHFFFESGAGSAIAFFHYLDTPRPADTVDPGSWLYNSVHTAWRVETREELDDWKARLEGGGQKVMSVKHEIIDSIYVTDPNGYVIEIAFQTRPMNGADALDAELTLEAAIAVEVASGNSGHPIDEVWQHKAALVDAQLDPSMPRIHVLDVPEFAGLVEAARRNPAARMSEPRTGYITIESDDELSFDRRECGFKPAVWYSCCSGGIDGTIAEYSRDTLRIVPAQRQG